MAERAVAADRDVALKSSLSMKSKSPKAQLAGFLAKFSPKIRAVVTAASAKLRRQLPGLMELVYDKFNALAVGFSPTDRTSEIIFSIAVYPRWVSLFFFQSGTKLSDPKGTLRGSGTKVRHIVLGSAEDLENKEIQALMKEAIALASRAIDSKARSRIIIKSVAAKQRPRKPGPKES